MCHYASSEGIVAEVDGSVVGVVFLNKRGDCGGGGPMAIDPDFQGKTIAPQLMTVFLEKARSLSSIRVVQEAFNPTSFSFQYAYDFMPVADLLDLELDGHLARFVVVDDPGSYVGQRAADLLGEHAGIQ
jgi:hypothetical protein